MLITPHSLTGATIAVLVPNPVIAIPLAIGSHYVLDSVPHWQETLLPYTPTKATWVRIPIDLALSIGLVYLIAQHHGNQAIIWVNAFMANAPDLDSSAVLIPQFFKNKFFKKYWDLHCRIQRETSSLWGILPQLTLSIVALWISLS